MNDDSMLGAKIRQAFEPITATESLQDSTLAHLHDEYFSQQTSVQKIKAKPKVKRPMLLRKAWALATFILVAAVGIFSFGVYNQEVAAIDIDVNPSLELKVNRFDRVIGIYAYNEDGQKVIEAIDVRNKPYEKALSVLIVQMESMGYITSDGQFTATLQSTSPGSESKILQRMNNCINESLASFGVVTHEVYPVDGYTKTCAHDQNMSPARYLAVLELQSYDATASFEGCRNRSLGELKEDIRGCMNRENAASGNGAGSGNGSGSGAGSAAGNGNGSGSGEGGAAGSGSGTGSGSSGNGAGSGNGNGVGNSGGGGAGTGNSGTGNGGMGSGSRSSAHHQGQGMGSGNGNSGGAGSSSGGAASSS